MKHTSHFGYRLLAVIVAVVAIANAAARNHRGDYDWEDGEPDSAATQTDTAKSRRDSSRRALRFPIYDKTGDPVADNSRNTFDLKDPSNVSTTYEYDPIEKKYYVTEKIGSQYYRTPTWLTESEYLKYQSRKDEQSYWRRRLDGLSLFNNKPQMPTMYKTGMFDRIFGGTTISVRPQGNVDVTFGGNWQNVKNPTLVQRAQRYGIFDFDMQMNVNLVAAVGDKLKLNISNNTKATFDYQNMQRLEYVGKEDEIIKKIEAGNISFPLQSTLINGVQSLFGLKTQLQFGRLWVTGVVSQQKSRRQSLVIQGGAQTQNFAMKADEYDENKHFLLGQYFRNNYNNALSEFPRINSLVTLTKIEVWVTNRTGAVDGVRDLLCFMDLGEKNPYNQNLLGGGQITDIPDNRANQLYNQLLQNPNGRLQQNATDYAKSILGSDALGRDFERTTARKLNPSEYTFNPQLGYISLNTTLNPDDVLGVAYRYLYNGKVFQVGEFAEDLPPDSNNTKVLYMKLLKGTAARPWLPVWDLMMKNIYSLGGIGVSKEDFRLNILYQEPGGGERRFISEGPGAGVPLLTLLNLDRLNFQNDPQPDGVFDFIDGITINTQQGKIIFPVLEPFGADLRPAIGANPQFERRYLYNILYDSTKTIARQFQQNNRYIIRGTYRSSSSSEIFLGGFNIPQGSVTVTAGGQRLIENQDYQIDYGLGRIKILNTGILNSGVPINIQYEDNATFGFQQQNFMGLHFDYFLNKKLALGGTFMRLSERPFTQKTSFGEDPIKNTVLGLNATYQSELPGLTRALDKLPLYSTTASSFITATGEVAGLFPGHPRQITALDPEGSVYIDDFEGTRSGYDLRLPAQSWSLASTPAGARDAGNRVLFPEATVSTLDYGKNRARLSWYQVEPTLVDGLSGIPDYVKKDPNQHYIRLVQLQDVFPTRSFTTLQNQVGLLDLTFYPKDRGPYNFDALNIDADGKLLRPQDRWGGIMRAIDQSDFEQSNVEFIEFWVMDPFINNQTSSGGALYLNLGNVSEDVLKDSRKFYENGIPNPKVPTQLDESIWGYVPRLQTQVVRAFDNDPAARAVQDVGYDGLNDDEERQKFAPYLSNVAGRVTNASVLQQIENDPANDNYRHFRSSDYDQGNVGVQNRYKRFNNPHGNSPVTTNTSAFSNAATNLPEAEDINRDNTLNESEDYYQYRIDMTPTALQVGQNYIVNKQVSNVRLPNGTFEQETWYQFKIPIREYQQRIGNISDFRSIRFIRMFLTGFQDSVTLRFARLELGRNQWRRYLFSLQNPGENIPEDDLKNVDFALASVSLEENSQRSPIPYVIPPGVNRQQAAVSNGQNVQLNEQALSLQVCGLKDGDARAVFKEVGVDMRQFGRLRMFIHNESLVGRPALKDGDLRAFIRIGSDFSNNYYEYQIPLKVTLPGTTDGNLIWAEQNSLDLALEDLVAAKTERNRSGQPAYVPFQKKDAKGNTIMIVGNPNVGEAKTIMLGILNPKKNNQNPGDDGLPKCGEVWFNELRMTGLNEKPGYAATGKVNVQLADLGTVRMSGSMHTQGYGNIDQRINQRFRDNFNSYDVSTNLNLGKLMPRKWGVQLPFYIGYTQNISNPEYDPYDLDVKYKDRLNGAKDARERDSLKKVAQDFTSITSFNLSNIRITGNPEKQNARPMPWSLKNFDASYAYNRQYKRNPLIQGDELTNHKLGLGYTYALRSKPVEPFKKLIKSRSKWFSLIKDFNFNLLPANFTFRTELNRIMNETQVRAFTDGPSQIQPTYYKNFTWLRTYALRWELTRSLSFDYSATNRSRIDEPNGRIDNQQKRDSLWENIRRFGRNTFYQQSFNASYNVPLGKTPVTDWTNLRATYGATYTYTAASQLARSLGNTISNTQTIQITGELDFRALYNKQRWLKAVNTPKPPSRSGGGAPPGRGGGPSKGGDSIDERNPGRDGKKGGADMPIDRDGRSARGGANGVSARRTESPDGALPDADADPAQSSGNADGQDRNTKQTRNNASSATNRNGGGGGVATGGGGGQPTPTTVAAMMATINTAGMSNKQVDSIRKVMEKKLADQKLAEKRKRKEERRKRRNKNPEISDAERFVGRILTAVKRTTITLNQTSGTVLPGYLDSTRAMGLNTGNMQPGLGFVYGYQPDQNWFYSKAADGKLTRDPIFNAQIQQQFSRTFNVQTTIEPFPDFRIDLTFNTTFTKNRSELFKDTGTGRHEILSPNETGSFNVSYVGVATMFKPSGAGFGTYQQFLDNREIVSKRLGAANPYTNNTPDPRNPNYAKGYTQYSQDVLVPSFIAAYAGKSAERIPLVDYSDKRVRANPFRGFTPMPNWKITYNGLSKLPFFKEYFKNLVVNHSYTGTLSMNSFVSALFYQDIYSVGFPSFLDSNSGNFVPFYQIPNLTISEQFAPFLGIDASFQNNVTARFEFRKSRNVSLSMIDYQVSETKSTEFVVGLGYRKRGLRLPFPILGVRKLKNDLNMKMDIGIRDDKSFNSYLAQNIDVVTRGQRVITISPSIDYIASEKLTVRIFYDRRQSIPYVSSAFPITTTRAGITLRFIFAQ